MKKFNIPTFIILLVSLLAFILSFTQNGIEYLDYDGTHIHSSIDLFIMGALSAMGGGLFEFIVWCANPLYFVAIYFLLKKNKVSMRYSALATALSVSFLFWENILAAENGRTAQITALLPGYFLWLGSIGLLLMACALQIKRLNSAK